MQKINAFAALAFCTDFNLSKVRSLLEHSCAILSFFQNCTTQTTKSDNFEVADSSGQFSRIGRFLEKSTIFFNGISNYIMYIKLEELATGFRNWPQVYYKVKRCSQRRGQGEFSRSVNPIQTMGGRLCPRIQNVIHTSEVPEESATSNSHFQPSKRYISRLCFGFS